MRKSVPVLITCDIDPTPEASPDDKQHALDRTHHLFERMGIKSTFFVVARTAGDYREQIARLVKDNHEIGCHGLVHDEKEEYTILPEKDQRHYLTEATRCLSDTVSRPVTSFRGPRVKTSHITQKILQELGYRADSSVCSQRVDFVSSNLINPHWIFAPRRPYHPHTASAFRKGTQPMVVVPVSALLMPFISGTLYIFGLAFMKRFFWLLYRESLWTGKPIVYILHPAEFADSSRKVVHRTTIQNIRARGFYFRRHLKLRKDPEQRYRDTEQLLQYIASFQQVRFMTVDHYIQRHFDAC